MGQIDVVVMGQNYSTSLGLIQAAGEAGFSCGAIKSVINPSHKLSPELKSRYVKQFIITNRNEEQLLLTSLINSFSSNKRRIVLIPSDDYSVSFIDRNLYELEKYFVVPNIAHQEGKMSYFMDKEVQTKLASKVGLPVAKCWSIKLDGSNNLKIPEDIIFPCIIKPLRSIGSSKSLINRYDTASELKRALYEINNSHLCDILIEEFIDIDNEYTVPGYSANGNVIVPAFIKKLETGLGAHKGVTIKGKVHNADKFYIVVKALNAFVKSIGIEGIFDIELLESNGKFYFNEMNLRYGAAGYALTRAGYNIPEKWIRYCLGLKQEENETKICEGLTFVSDKAAIESYRAGYMSLKDYFRLLKSADFRFIIDNGDTAAKKCFRRIEVKSILAKIIKG